MCFCNVSAEKTLTFYSRSFCDVYGGGTRVYYDTDYSSDAITVAADIRLLIFFFDASAGIIRDSKITVVSTVKIIVHLIYFVVLCPLFITINRNY